MATYAEVVKFEDAAPPGTIRLVKSGEFYRAYNPYIKVERSDVEIKER